MPVDVSRVSTRRDHAVPRVAHTRAARRGSSTGRGRNSQGGGGVASRERHCASRLFAIATRGGRPTRAARRCPSASVFRGWSWSRRAGLAGSLGVADQRPATRDPGRNQRPAPRDPERPRLHPGHDVRRTQVTGPSGERHCVCRLAAVATRSERQTLGSARRGLSAGRGTRGGRVTQAAQRSLHVVPCTSAIATRSWRYSLPPCLDALPGKA
jgi:hypothetical protein